jgi:hypothetical protein
MDQALSPIEKIRARREALKQRKSIDLLVPGYQGQVAIRFKPVDDAELEKFANATIRDDGDSKIDAAFDLILRAHDVVLIREGDDLVPLVNEEESPVGLTLELGRLLEFPDGIDTARGVVRELFSPDGTAPAAAVAVAGALISWLQGNEADIGKSLLGE